MPDDKSWTSTNSPKPRPTNPGHARIAAAVDARGPGKSVDVHDLPPGPWSVPKMADYRNSPQVKMLGAWLTNPQPMLLAVLPET
jgi:hypothetical protein